MILERSSLGKLNHGITKAITEETNIPLRTIQLRWLEGKKAGGLQGVLSKRTKNCGRKRIAFNEDAIKDIDLRKRTSLQDLANELNMAKTTLFRRLKEGRLRRHSNAIKSTLTEENKRARVQFCLSMFQPLSIPEEPTFDGMYNVIHIDEKWFYRTRKNQKFYLGLNEEDPKRTTQNKNHIEKVMFLDVVVRPRYDDDGNMTFDGKIGIWPFTFLEEAKRDSKNRDAGTIVTKVLPAVTRKVSQDYMVNKLLPAIKEKWPASDRGYPIIIQQDNAKTHIPVSDPMFCEAAMADGWNIRLTCQPPNSPDLNILDLGFFCSPTSFISEVVPRFTR